MSEIDFAPFRDRLVEERTRLANAVVFLERENPGSLTDELGELAAGDNHLGDTASATFDRELDQGLEEGARETLQAIDDALRRIEEGTYGVCEVCGKAIGEQRLAAIPWARRCIDDQRRAGA